MKILFAIVGLSLMQPLMGASLSEIVQGWYAPDEVAVVFAVPSNAHAERLNEVSRLTAVESSLHSLLEQLREDSTERALIWTEIRKQRALAERQVQFWKGIEARCDQSLTLMRYYVNKNSGFETGFALVRDGVLIERFMVESSMGDLTKQ